MKTINKEYEKTRSLEAKIKQDNDAIIAKEKKTQEITAGSEKLEEEITQLKRDAPITAAAAGNAKLEKAPEQDKEALRQKVKEEQEEGEAEIQKTKKEVQEQQTILFGLKNKLKELDQSNRVNAHKILECTRLVKLSKMKAASPVATKTAAEKLKEERMSKSEKMQKYRRMKLKKTNPV